MKTRKFIYWIAIGFVISLFISFTPHEETKYYYAFDKKTYLVPQQNILMVKFAKRFDKVRVVQFLRKADSNINVRWVNPMVSEVSTGSSKSFNSIKMKLKKQKNVLSVQPHIKLSFRHNSCIFTS